MRRNEGRTCLHVGRLTERIRDIDLEHEFNKYGSVRRLQRRASHYAFVDFTDAREADEARRRLNGIQFHGSRITVVRGPRGVLLSGTDRCFNCGERGHWARDCRKASRCFHCAEEDHIARDCRTRRERRMRSSSPASSPVRRSRSRSPVRRRQQDHVENIEARVQSLTLSDENIGSSGDGKSARRIPSPRP